MIFILLILFYLCIFGVALAAAAVIVASCLALAAHFSSDDRKSGR
jgi:hypothetical protein